VLAKPLLAVTKTRYGAVANSKSGIRRVHSPTNSSPRTKMPVALWYEYVENRVMVG